jgi:hypothetical protein
VLLRPFVAWQFLNWETDVLGNAISVHYPCANFGGPFFEFAINLSLGVCRNGFVLKTIQNRGAQERCNVDYQNSSEQAEIDSGFHAIYL